MKRISNLHLFSFVKAKTVIALLAFLASIGASTGASAAPQRALIRFKNSSAAQKIFELQLRSATTWDQGTSKVFDGEIQSQMAKLLPEKGVQFEKGLNHLDRLIVKLDSKESLEALKMNPQVESVEAEVFHPAPRPHGALLGAPLKQIFPAAPSQTPWGILAIRSLSAWTLGGMGEGSRVLVLDTGIDRDHPSLKENFEKGANFVGDSPTPYPYADSEGHGTHVAGTIAGVLDSSGFSGVAPKTKILSGRVCAPEGCSNISIAAGINWGIEEKVDVISMSLGGAWATPAEREAILKAYRAGITLVAASGNDGSSRVGYPAALDQVIAVGAVDSDGKRAAFSQYGTELDIVAPGVDVKSSVPVGMGRVSDVVLKLGDAEISDVKSTAFQGSKIILEPVTGNFVFGGRGNPEELAQVPVRGNWALIERGDLTFGDKAKNARAAGAKGVIIYNNTSGLVRGTVAQNGETLSIPVFGIEKAMGEKMLAALKAGQVVSGKMQVLISDYANMDGTSMATPHVSGVVALIKAVNKKLSPEEVLDVIRKSAQVVSENPENQYGAGVVNAEAAVREAMLRVHQD